MEMPSLEEEAMSEGFYEDPWSYYDEYDEIKPGDAGTEDDEDDPVETGDPYDMRGWDE